MALLRPLADWPLLICGPLLRRVTQSEITVFVATKASCSVLVVVRDTENRAVTWESAPQVTRALGPALHVAVVRRVQADTDALLPGRRYEYDVRMTPVDGGATQALADQPGLLTGPTPLGYAANALPTFALPPGLADLNLLHGSCRKPHGGGPDALAMADRLVQRAGEGADAATNARRRPHQLLLTGDQIYADDVALAMLHTLREAGALLAAPETFPDGLLLGAPELVPGTTRKRYLAGHTELSSDHGMNHLMFFAEFCAMYVMCWSDELWPRVDGIPTVGAADVEEELREDDAKQRVALAEFLRTVRPVRRALANIPTLMMFDDHEISDDWYIDGDWYAQARADAGLRRIVRNGLLAFAVFQAWGNAPAEFDAGPPLELLDVVAIPPGAAQPPIATDPAMADEALDLAGGAGTRVTWDWTIDGPEHRVITLDTRTWRDYVSAGPERPGLIPPAELQRQLADHRLTAGDRLCFVVSPAPVVGHPLVERNVAPVYSLFKGSRAADEEAWSVNMGVYQALLRALAEFGRVVVLSGDVHYAYTNHTAYFGAGGLAPARVVQLCSSAAKNADGMTGAIQVAGYLLADGEGWLGFPDPVAEDLGAKLMRALRTPPPAEVSVAAVYDNLAARIAAFRMFKGPSLVPTGPWGPLELPAIRELAERGDVRDWRYRVTFVRDRRNGATRLAGAAEIDPRPITAGQEDHVRASCRAVVGIPNLGQIRVLLDGADAEQVVHRLHWMTPGAPDAAVQTCTEHVAPLRAPSNAERPVPTG